MCTDLFEACGKGDLEAVRALLAAGADVNAQSRFGWTALMHASSNGHEPVVRALLAAGADVEAQDWDRWTALMYASMNRNVSVVQVLLVAGADPFDNCNHPLVEAARQARIARASELFGLVDGGLGLPPEMLLPVFETAVRMSERRWRGLTDRC